MTTAPLILLAAGGTGGHLFPAEALAVELMKRGMRVRLVTDSRALRYSGLFTKDLIDVVPSETVRGRDPWSLARTGAMLAAGAAVALNLMRRLKPAAVVGFGGYPTLPPLIAARLFGIPSVIHDSNAVLGRANRFLSSRVSAIATSLPGVLDQDPALAAKTTTTGTPMRPAILAAAAVKFESPEPMGPLRLLVVGGSQGARVMADIVPGAIERLEPALWDRLVLAQQVREEDMARVRAVYDRLLRVIDAELAPFFTDLPVRRLASSYHLVISRSGAGTVAELSGAGRPALDPRWCAAAGLDRSGPVRQCRRAGAGERRDPNRAGGFHARPAGRGNLRVGRRAGAAGGDGRRRAHRRQARCRRAAGRSGGEKSPESRPTRRAISR